MDVLAVGSSLSNQADWANEDASEERISDHDQQPSLSIWTGRAWRVRYAAIITDESENQDVANVRKGPKSPPRRPLNRLKDLALDPAQAPASGV